MIMKSIANVWICFIILNTFHLTVLAQNRQEGLVSNSNGAGKWSSVSNIVTPEQSRNKLPDSDSCIVPPKTLDKTITYSCPSTPCETESEYVPRSTYASIVCKPNFYPEKKTPSSSTCSNNMWIPPIEDCFKRCDKLNPVNVDLRCMRNGTDVPCNENTLIAGIKVRPTCKPFHKYRDAVPDYLEMTCEEDGKWDRTLFSCIPECGIVYTNSSHRFDQPWHVAIYKSKVLICSGTIISPYLVLTAAHCFYENNILANNTSNYEVVTSKETRNYHTQDNDNQKSFKIKEIRFSSKGYFGSTDQYSSDIAVIILEEKLPIGAAVLPACVDWISIKRPAHPTEDTPATVSGWWENQRGTSSEILTSKDLQFIGRKRCLAMVPLDFKPFITFDKFCAIPKGSSALNGNNGAGLIFYENSLYYLGGISSAVQPTKSSLNIFTDLADHIEWISAAHNETEYRTLPVKKVTPETSGEHICNNYGVSNCTKIQDCILADVLIATKKAIFCGYDINDSERICCAPEHPPQIPPPPEVPYSVTTITPKPAIIVRNSTITAEKECAKYSEQHCSEIVEPRIGKIEPAWVTEFPHVVVIGCGSGLKDVYGCLMGSLISESFILSVPPKDTNMITKWALLDVNLLKYESSKSFKRYEIDKRYFHPNYAFPRNSIALYKLKSSVTLSGLIRPACLNTPDFSLINRKLITTRWGNSRSFMDSGATSLYKTSAVVIDDQQCWSADEKSSYDPKLMTCVANLTTTEAFSLINRGNALKISTGSKSCGLWSIFAVFSGMQTVSKFDESLGESKQYIYTKVSPYLDWIEGIVWPMSRSSGSGILQQLSSSAAMPTLVKVNWSSQQTSIRRSAEIASSYCQMYSTYATDCVSDAPPRRTRRKALAKEYPHIALIGCQSDKPNTYWTSIGSLISERFVMSTAYCETDEIGVAKWVHLGAVVKSIVKSETYDRIYDIERTYIHPEYNFPRRSIALYKLKTIVEFNSYIRPACLYTSNTNQINNQLRISSWGNQLIPGGRSDDLMKGMMTVVDDQRCSNVTIYDSNSMACAGDGEDGEAQCLINAGSPLQILQENKSCVWSIYAMYFANVRLPSSCGNVGNAGPYLFTRISYYLDWIQGIVWPN